MSAFSADPYPFCDECAPLFDALTIEPELKPEYELLSTGLMWADEMPGGLCFDCKSQIRFVWGVRAAVIRGAELRKHRYRYLWDGIVSRYPNWPGLRSARRAPTLAPVLKRLHDEARSEIDEMTDELTASQRIRVLSRQELEKHLREVEGQAPAT